jgi:hypothetical protein
MIFKGQSCNIADSEGNPILNRSLRPIDGQIIRVIKAGY